VFLFNAGTAETEQTQSTEFGPELASRLTKKEIQRWI